MKPATSVLGRAALRGAALLCLTAVVGCGPQFDPSNELKTLRVLGVKKDKPYAQPGDEVNLQLLWHDPKGRKDAEVQRAFIGGCVNPPGDLYYGCFAQYGQGGAPGAIPIGSGDTFKITVPSDIISSRGEGAPGQPRYGVSIVFFAVCAGTLDFEMGAAGSAAAAGGLPVRCLDNDSGEPLGSEDFVVGYSTVYSFEGISNQNPSFTVDEAKAGEFLIDGKAVPADCVGGACQGFPAVEVDCEATPERCIKSCADDGDASCPAIDVKPALDKVIEQDDVSTALFGERTTEQMWINYYIDRGGISEVRLVNDTNSGWNDKYRGELRAPKDAGPLQIWAVVHDNRGGMEFTRVTLGVK